MLMEVEIELVAFCYGPKNVLVIVELIKLLKIRRWFLKELWKLLPKKY